jgi:hypothetical protein
MSRGRRRPDAQSTAQRLVAAEPDHSVRGSAHVGDPYDPQQVVGLGVRLFAIWLALIGLDKLGGYFTTLARPGWKEPAEYLLVVPLLYWLVAALLWFFPMSVAHRLVPKTRFENVLSFAPLELARVGTALLGLWLLATSMPWLATVLVRVVAFPAPGGSFFRSSASWRQMNVFICCRRHCPLSWASPSCLGRPVSRSELLPKPTRAAIMRGRVRISDFA